MTFMPSFSVLLIALCSLTMLVLANWYVSGFSVEPGPDPREDRVADFCGRNGDDKSDDFKKVA